MCGRFGSGKKAKVEKSSNNSEEWARLLIGVASFFLLIRYDQREAGNRWFSLRKAC